LTGKVLANRWCLPIFILAAFVILTARSTAEYFDEAIGETSSALQPAQDTAVV